MHDVAFFFKGRVVDLEVNWVKVVEISCSWNASIPLLAPNRFKRQSRHSKHSDLTPGSESCWTPPRRRWTRRAPTFAPRVEGTDWISFLRPMP